MENVENRTKKKRLRWMDIPIIILIVAVWLVLRVYWSAPYAGRLVDAQTGDPVEGVLILADWNFHFLFGSSSCLDARETVSDAFGDFTVSKSLYGEIFGSPSFYIYKVGYEMIGAFFFHSLKQDAPPQMVQWDGRMPVFQLKKVAKGSLIHAGAGPPYITCGRRDGKPLSEYFRVCEEFRQAYGQEIRQKENRRY